MLTGPLLMTRFRNGKAYPCKIQAEGHNLKVAAMLIQLFKDAKNLRRFELDAEIRNQDIGRINPKTVQGLAKILINRSNFAHSGSENPMETRAQVFSSSAQYWSTAKTHYQGPEFHRQVILNQLKFDQENILNNTEAWLFGDMISYQKLIDFNPILPRQLIHRYNIEQVQGLLLNTIDLEIRISKCFDRGFRQLMQMMRFFRLMFTITSYQRQVLTLKIDGPGSVLENPRSYGLEIAQFFPSVWLLKEPWHLTAKLKIPGRSRIFRLELSDQDPYQTHYVEKGVWANEKIAKLINRINEKYPDQFIASTESTIYPLSRNRYLLPDVCLKSVSGNRIYQLEWIRYLSNEKIQFLTTLDGELPANYIIAVKGKRRKLERLTQALGSRLIIFANELTASAIRKAIEGIEKDAP